MTWKELVEGCASVGILPKYPKPGTRRSVPKKTAETMLRATFNVIAEKALHGERVSIPGFGVFYKRTRKSRRIANPQTKELMQLPATVSIGFRTSKQVSR